MIFVFGDFELDEEQWELRERGRALATPPKALQLLHYLVRNRNRVVSKAELFNTLWQGTQVTEASLNNAISAVRRVVHDDGDRQELVKTARSRGYRFAGVVREIGVESLTNDRGIDGEGRRTSSGFLPVCTVNATALRRCSN